MRNQDSITQIRGFTIVELLVVIVVVGILAAIVIIAYNGVTIKAQNARNLANVTDVRKKIEYFYVETGQYPDLVCGNRRLCITTTPPSGTPVPLLTNIPFGHLSAYADPAKYTNYGGGGWPSNTLSSEYGYNIQFCRPDASSPVTGIRIYYPYNKKTATITAGSSEECV